tara:strand:- start:3962 stop:4450 length:489 start_codon:yes stop_codon:yes gene_type:complete
MLDVRDDFLPEGIWNDIKTEITGKFPWYWSDSVLSNSPVLCEPQYNHQFFNVLYANNLKQSDKLFVFAPVLDALEVRSLVRVKANLNVRTDEIVRHGFHTDFKGMTTAILYCNTNDGFTEFKDGTIIESVENRLVIFPSDMRHTGTTCTNAKNRIVVNINYF